MPTKQEILNRLFWLRLVCIHTKRFKLAHNLQILHSVYYETAPGTGHDERTLKLLARFQTKLCDLGIDWENCTKELMLKNDFTDYKMMSGNIDF